MPLPSFRSCLSALALPVWMAAFVCMASAAIKPAPPRQGLEPAKSAAAPAKPEAPPAPAKPAQPVKPAPADPSKPLPNLLKDFGALEKIHADPAKSREAISRCEALRNALVTYPGYFQKLQFFWAVALAHSGNLGEASEKFALASSPTAPDQSLAHRALNAHTSFMLRDPMLVDRAVELVKNVISRTQENSPEQLTARFNGACALYILSNPTQAAAALEPVDTALLRKSGDPELEALKQNTSNLLAAIAAEEAAKNPDNPPHVFYAPWRGVEIRQGLGINRRIAELAFILRDFPRALALYTALEKDAANRRQAEIQAWSRMQRGRLLYITGNLAESEKLLSSFQTSSPFKDANCAPFAILRLALLYHNYLKDIPKAEKSFETATTKFRNTPEGIVCEYYRAMIPFLVGNSRAALPLFVSFTKAHPEDPLSDYLTGHLIPGIEKQLAAASTPPVVR